MTSVMNLSQWLTHLETLHPTTMELGLDRVRAVATALQLVPFAPFTITVAGTNGKGSTSQLLANIYQQAGYAVGCYTSPHLLRFNERIKIAGREVSDTQLCETFALIEQARGDISLTYFEFATLAALHLFQQQEVTLAILEVGLGGRLDATNIVDADIAVITNVALDHQQWLGDNREAIAKEKAGILRPNQQFVYGEYHLPASIAHLVEQNSIALYQLGQAYDYQLHLSKLTWSELHWQSQRNNTTIICQQPNIHPQNVASSLMVVELLQDKFSVPLATLPDAVKQVQMPGRWQVLDMNGVKHIFDVAHNAHSAKALAGFLQEYLRQHPSIKQVYGLFSLLADKDFTATIEPLVNSIDQWWYAPLEVDRGMSRNQLAEQFLAQGIAAHSAINISSAYEMLMDKVSSNDIVLIFGSFHTVAEVYEIDSQMPIKQV